MSDKKLITFIILACFFYRISVIYNTKVTFFSDDALYVSLARFFFQGDMLHAFHPTWPPLYPFLSSLTYGLLQNWETSLQLVSAISGALTAVPLYLLFKQLFGKLTAALVSMLITSFTPFLWASVYPLSDMLALFFVETLLVATFLGIQKQKPKYFLLSSILLGLLFLTRSEGSMFFGLTLVFLFIYFFYQIVIRKVFSPRTAFVLPSFIALFLLISSPYIIATKIQLGEWTLSQKFAAQAKQSHSFELRNDTTWSQEVVSIRNPNYKSDYFRGGPNHIIENIDWFAWWFEEKLGKWVNSYIVTTPIWFWAITLIGVLSMFRKKYFWGLGFLLWILFAAIPLTIFSTPLVDLRYLLWSLPILIFIFSLGIKTLTKINSPRLTAVITILCLTQMPFFNFRFATNPKFFGEDITRTMNWEETRLAAGWINENKNTAHPKIMMRHEGIEFYTEGETIYMPQIPYQEIIEYAKVHDVDYLIAWDKEIAGDKEVSFLLNPTLHHPELVEMYRTEDSPTPHIVVYALTSKTQKSRQ
jgi:4-amino-4-deoxy-L-arabinose transferase-like glycosyltransferase